MKKKIISGLACVSICAAAATAASCQEMNMHGNRSAARCEAVKGLYTLDGENRITVTRVIGTYGRTAEEGYRAAMELVAGGLPDAIYNIISDDSQTLAFNAEGYYDAFYQRKPGSRSGLGCHVDSRLRIESRDGRLRATVTVLRYRNDAVDVDARTVYPFLDRNGRDRNITGVMYIAEPVTVPRSHASRYFNAAVTAADDLLEYIGNRLAPADNDNEW